jgi:hypothetical protein
VCLAELPLCHALVLLFKVRFATGPTEARVELPSKSPTKFDKEAFRFFWTKLEWFGILWNILNFLLEFFRKKIYFGFF